MVYADLHVHTTVSDGVLAPSAVPDVAREAGLSVVAITDHDRLQPALDAPVEHHDGLMVINGMELRVDPGDGQERVDLLAYGLRPTAALRREVDRLQTDRKERARAMVSALEDRLGVSLDLELEPGVGRPHIARAVVDHPETKYTGTDAVFAELIGDGGPCFVARDVTSFDRGVTLLSEAAQIVGLAHPLRYEEPAAALALCDRLDAVERHYPYGRPVDQAAVETALETNDLLATGGSDAHDRQLAVAGLTEAAFEPLRRALPGA
ncbi:MAG: PHP domain-containing protein [Halobacteriaceae archaeon]